MNPRPPTIVYGALATSAFFWGAGFAVSRFALRWATPLDLLAGSGIVAALAQVLWSAARGGLRKLLLPSSIRWPLLVVGLIGQGILNGFTFFGLARTTATQAALLYGFSPMMIGIFARLFLHEPWPAKKRLGSLVGFAGITLVITQGKLENVGLPGPLLGNLLVFGGALYWAAYAVITRSFTQVVRPEVYTFWVITLGAIVPALWAGASNRRFLGAGVELHALAAITFVGVATTTAAMNLWNWGLSQIEASRVGVFTYLEPVFAAALGMIFLGERLTLATAVGGALVFAGIFLSALAPPSSKPKR